MFLIRRHLKIVLNIVFYLNNEKICLRRFKDFTFFVFRKKCLQIDMFVYERSDITGPGSQKPLQLYVMSLVVLVQSILLRSILRYCVLSFYLFRLKRLRSVKSVIIDFALTALRVSATEGRVMLVIEIANCLVHNVGTVCGRC